MPDEQHETQKREREWVRNPNGPNDIYSNYVDASWNIFDVRVLFGQLKPTALNLNEFTVEEQGSVTMCWAQLKNMLGVLSGMMQAYEHVNGEIPQLNLAPRFEDIMRDEGK